MITMFDTEETGRGDLTITLGELIAKVEELGGDESTVLVFQTDGEPLYNYMYTSDK